MNKGPGGTSEQQSMCFHPYLPDEYHQHIVEPEYVPRKSKYPVINLVRGSMLPVAHVFSTSMYSYDLPRAVQKMKKKRHPTMSVEMDAL